MRGRREQVRGSFEVTDNSFGHPPKVACQVDMVG
jgi:hypothetical protein